MQADMRRQFGNAIDPGDNAVRGVQPMRTGSIRAWRWLASTALASGALNAHAQELPASASSEPGPICTDRPTKSNYACVVDTGHFQYEADIVNASRLDVNGSRTDVINIVNTTLKYGLARNVDIELSVAPAVSVRVRDASGMSTTLRGVGDTVVRAKWNVLADRASGWSATLLPWVKAPTARRGIGNSAVEGGLIVPINYQLTDSLVITTAPQFDALKNAADGGRHLSTSQLINVSWSLPHGVTLYGELWGNWNFDRSATTRQFSADVAIAKLLGNRLQLDVGVNVGLNRFTPGVQGYLGISQKF